MDTLDERQLEILKGVLTYLNEHPDAKDTLEGIGQWWLHPAVLRPARRDLLTVLDLLVENGCVLAFRGATPATTFYGGNPQQALPAWETFRKGRTH